MLEERFKGTCLWIHEAEQCGTWSVCMRSTTGFRELNECGDAVS